MADIASRYSLVSFCGYKTEPVDVGESAKGIVEFYVVATGVYEVWTLENADVFSFIQMLADDRVIDAFPDLAGDSWTWKKHDSSFLMPQASRKYVRKELAAFKRYTGKELYTGPFHPHYASEKGAGSGPARRDPAEQPLKVRNLSSRDRFAQDDASFARRRKTNREMSEDDAFHEYHAKPPPQNPFKPEPEHEEQAYATPILLAQGANGELKFWRGCLAYNVSRDKWDVVVTFGRDGTGGQDRVVGSAFSFTEAKQVLDARMNNKTKRGYTPRTT